LIEYFLPLHDTAEDLFACKIPERKPSTTMIPPIGAPIEFAMFRFNPILVSIIDAEKIVTVEIIAEINNVMNDKFNSNAIIEYPNNGIGMNKMNNTAKNTPIAVEEL
tara:strand:- start:8 stop:328 length:321 start_codon:yes stop_codon:yes gene_type:complete